MALHKEPLSGGLNTAVEPGLLELGELAGLQNYVYRGGSNTLWYAYGRQIYATASATVAEVDGIRDIHFDNGDHYLVALVSGANAMYRYVSVSGAATSGTFADLATLAATGQSLERAHFRNRFFLFDGATASASSIGTNTVVYLSATATNQTPTTRQHGMLPVEAGPTVSTAAGTFSQASAGTFPAYYEYWTTEVAKFNQDGAQIVLESTFAAKPTTVLIQTSAVVPTIQMPPVRNSITTHWRVYRSPRKDFETDTKFPAGFMIAEQQVASGTAASASAAAFVTDTITVSNTAFIFPATANGGSEQYASWTNPGNLFSDNGAVATRAGVTWGVPLGQGVYNFGFGNFIGTIRGIEVQFEAAVSAGNSPITVSCRIGRNRQPNGGFVPDSLIPFGAAAQSYLQRNTAARGINVTGTAGGVYTLGGSGDRWLPNDAPSPFVDSDFNSNFMVVLEAIQPSGKTLAVDYVAVKVYYAATFDSTVQFPAVSYTFGDITAQVGKNGPPPSSNTGDVYEDTLVVNDINSPSFVRYSFPGEPESFPQTYFVDFETADNDKVTLVKVVNNRLVVGLDTSIWRMNYLPSERDASFDRGKAIEVISRSYGVINPMCACTFTVEGGQEFLAFVSQKGLHTTDGYNFQTRSGKLSWRGEQWTHGVLEFTNSAAIALLNDPEQQELLLYYRNDNIGSNSYLCLHFSYAPGSVGEDGSFKCSGPVSMRNYDSGSATFAALKSAWAVPRANGNTSIFLGYGGANTAPGAGRVFIEATGAPIQAFDGSAFYKTRRMFLAGPGEEWRANQLMQYMHSHTQNRTVTFSTDTVKTNRPDPVAGQASKTVSLEAATSGTHFRVPFSVGSEGIIFKQQDTTSSQGPAGIEYLLIDGDGFGDEDSGR